MNHIPEKLRQFLKRHKIYYQIVVHPQTFTSLQTAEAECVCGKNVTKVVMAKVRGKDTMLVLPSSHTVDLFKLSSVLGTQDVSIEEEREFQDLFSDCEVGAMPPFGAIYHIPCYADKSVRESSELYFNAGTHTESIKISTADFLKVMKGHVLDFAVLGQKVAA